MVNFVRKTHESRISEILRIPQNGRNRNLEIFFSFYFQENYRCATYHQLVKSTETIFSKFFGQPCLGSKKD